MVARDVCEREREQCQKITEEKGSWDSLEVHMADNVLTIISSRFLTSLGRFHEANMTLWSGNRFSMARRNGLEN